MIKMSIISLRHTTHAKTLMRYHAEGCRRKYNGDVIPTGFFAKTVARDLMTSKTRLTVCR
jgi:hypothetical protein